MRRPPMRRALLRRAPTNSSRVARSGPLRPAAPGSPTREIDRMLEIERQNREPVDSSAGSNGPDGPAGAVQSGSAQSGSTEAAGSAQAGPVQGGGLLRRARRAVTRPAGPPAAEPPAAPGAPAEPPAAAQQPAPAQQPAAESEPRASGATATGSKAGDTPGSNVSAGDSPAGAAQGGDPAVSEPA